MWLVIKKSTPKKILVGYGQNADIKSMLESSGENISRVEELLVVALVQNKLFIPTLLYLFKSTRYKTRDK